MRTVRPASRPFAITFRAVLLFASAAATAAAAGCGRARQENGELPSDAAAVELAGEGEPAVQLVVDFGDGVQKRFARIPHQDGMTVLGVLQFAGRHPRGIRFQESGSGESVLVTRIDDLSNQGGADGKNWLYRVNDKLAEKSAGAYVLRPGDVILWRYEQGSGMSD